MRLGTSVIRAAGLLTLLPVSFSAHAVNPESSFVVAHAVDMIDGQLTGSQIALMQSLAHQAAIASICDGFVLDDDKFVAAFGRLAHESEAQMSAEQKTYFERHVLVVYGVLVGGELAEAAEDPGGTCQHAEELRADAELADDLVWE